MKRILTNNKVLFLALTIYIVFLLFFKLGDTYLTNWDEAWYGDISRNMMRSGNLVTPIFNREPFFDKPPLYFWLTAFSFRMFGVSEFSQRFFSALSGVGTGILVYCLARLLANSYGGFISVFVLFSSVGFLYRARTGNLDTLLTFFILLSVVSFYKGYLKKSNKWFLLFGISIGLGFLAKGVVSFLFPLVASLYLLLLKDMISLRKTITAVCLGIGIALSWVFVSYLANGERFLSDFYTNQTSKVYATPFFWANFSFDYIWHIKSGMKLWFLFLIPCIFYLTKKSKVNHYYLLLVVYFISFYVILLFSRITSNWFLMPLYPIGALIIGIGVCNITSYYLGRKFLIPILFIIVGISFFQQVRYKNEYIVPNVSFDEAQVAQAAKRLTNQDDVLYLTNYYFPTTIFYSNRKVYAVYSEQEENQAWWVKPRTAWREILKGDRVFVATTREEFKNLSDYFSPYKFEILYQSGQKLLLKRV